VLLEPKSENTTASGEDQCRFRDGKYRGKLYLREGKLSCEYDPKAPGVRIRSVDYADVDGDGFLDAVLFLVKIGSGRGRQPWLLTLSRKQPGDVFYPLSPMGPGSFFKEFIPFW
jgi:hypothetical protein